MKRAELEAVLLPARAAVEEAAELVRHGFRKRVTVEHKGAVDLVTHFDRESEALLRARLTSLSFPIVGEEQGGTWDRSGSAFFIDPIDGTTNFVHGHPFWCVSVGLVDPSGAPILGVVRAPVLGLEWYGFVADDGMLARRRSGDEEEDCVVSDTAHFQDSLLATGFPYDRRSSADNNFDAFVAIKKRCQAVRRCGSAALDLCLVADGTYEGYWERKLGPWDIAGGIAIVRAAGGRVSELALGSDHRGCITSGHAVATNGRIHDRLLEELGNVGPHSMTPSR